MSKHMCSDQVSVFSQYNRVFLQQDMFGNTQAKNLSDKVITQINVIHFVEVMELVSKWGRVSARISSRGSDFEINGIIPLGQVLGDNYIIFAGSLCCSIGSICLKNLKTITLTVSQHIDMKYQISFISHDAISLLDIELPLDNNESVAKNQNKQIDSLMLKLPLVE